MANTITQWRPGTHINGNWRSFPTFKELKKNLKTLIKENGGQEITIYRSRRGEWGEWWEKWILTGEKLRKTGAGWS